MKRSRNPSLRTILLLLPGLVLALSGGASDAAVQEKYCQYPPYVVQTVLPSVTLLVSNSQSMGKFAYGDPTNDCATDATPCRGFDPAKKYYGIFLDNAYYTNAGSNAAGGSGFTFAGYKGTYTKDTGGNRDWDGNFLNWLTTRRVDVMKKVLTGGDGSGTQACGSVTEQYKEFTDTSATYSPFSGTQTVQFPIATTGANPCSGASTAIFSTGGKNYQVAIRNPGTTAGIIQEMTPKASLGLAFFNDRDSEGAFIDPQIDGTNLPISAYRNRIDTPSRFNGMTVGAPLGEALWTIVGQYARIGGTSATGPRYHGAADYVDSKDPYVFHGNPSRCVKGSVIIISDGEPCSDGSLPDSYAGVDIREYADGTTFDCKSDECQGAGGFPDTDIPACDSGGAVAGLEDVALFAHTRDLRNSPTFGADALANKQNLDIFVIRAFGTDNSNLLKYAAINGTFEDANGNGIPDAGEYGLDKAYFQADDGAAIERALRDIFVNILRRATSGTAASVLASGEGSGANLVQAVFYPRRRFFDEVVEWTGTLQNLWYYVDPFFSGASIREDSNQDKVLNLVTDNTVVYFFDTSSQTTKANRYANNTTTGRAQGTPTVIPFEQVKAIWEAGGFLHTMSPGSRRIFTMIDNTGLGMPLLSSATNAFTESNATSLGSFLGAASVSDAEAIIRYVRGSDDVTGDGVIDFRQRTVPYPANTGTDNTVWKLGDIINSTPKIASRVPINTYEKTYSDTTYKSFTASSTYKNRGMVFVGANDGMLHAFKLGKLEFPGDASWPISGPDTKDRARLVNLDNTFSLGSERWAFIPKNALPYLKAMLDNSYCHLYYVDLSPYLVDASIGAPPTFASDNAARTSLSWRTILIGGMRYGGACRDNTVTCYPDNSGNCVASPVTGNGFSSYFAIDVTDPESPSVLWEFSNPALGFATTGPAVVRVNARNASGVVDRSLNGKWFVVFGSGPTGPISDRQFLGRSDQTLKLFVLDLRTGALLRTIERDYNNDTIPNAFAGSMINSTADFNLDYQDDAVYLGYVKENAGVWNQGGVLRLQTKGDPNPANWETSRLVDNVGPVTSSIARLQSNTWHTNWLFFGTGRYYFASAAALDDPTAPRHLYGVKDPCFTYGNTINPSCTTTVSAASLQTVTDATIIDEATANSPGFPGWKIELDTTTSVDYDGTGAKNYQAERVITDPLAAASGVVFLTTFRPYGDDCAIGGRTFLWGVRYNTGGIPLYALQGRALIQVSTASVEQLDLGDAFSRTPSGSVDSLHRGGRRSYALEGVPPTAQGLSLQIAPSALKRILHMKER